MKLNAILVVAFHLAFTANTGWALEIRNGTIEFTYDRVFYNNLPSTLESALVHPGVRSTSKARMIDRMAADPNLPGNLYEVLFTPNIHRDRDVTFAVMHSLHKHHPHHLSRLGQFPFAIEAVVDLLTLRQSERFQFSRSHTPAMCVEIGNQFLDQALSWLEEVPATSRERVKSLAEMRFFTGTGDTLFGTPLIFEPGRRFDREEKAVAYENLLLHLRAARVLIKFGILERAKALEAVIARSLPPESHLEGPVFEEELAQVRKEAAELKRLVNLAPVAEAEPEPVLAVSDSKPAPIVVEAPVPLPLPSSIWTDVDDRPAEKPLLEAAAKRDGFAMSIAIARWPEGVRLSKRALVMLSDYLSAPGVEMSTALRKELEKVLMPQLEIRRSELAYEVNLSPRNRALLDACNTQLMGKKY